MTGATPGQIRDWLKAQGFDPARVDRMSAGTLDKAYRHPDYLRSLKRRGDYYPPCSRTKNNATQLPARTPEHLRSGISLRPDASMAPASVPSLLVEAPSMAETRVVPAVQLTEARVIELIRMVVAEMLQEEEW